MKIIETISDKQAIKIGQILLKTSISSLYVYNFEKITRIKYDPQDGTDAEESINVYFNGNAIEAYKSAGWKDNTIMIKIIVHDRYHDYTYFYGSKKDLDSTKISWDNFYLSNHIDAVLYLQENDLLQK